MNHFPNSTNKLYLKPIIDPNDDKVTYYVSQSEVYRTINNAQIPIFCLNDSDKLKNFTRVRYMVDSCFKHKFPDKCKYEI